jgi:transcription antitermination factor NusG
MAFWAVARTQTRRECVAAHFLALGGFETYRPRILRSHTSRKGLTLERPAPLFPSYVFVLITLQWHAVNNTIGVVRLIMDGGHPARLADTAVAQVRARELEGYVQLPPASPRFHHGQRVSIIRGPFEGHDGLYAGQAAHERERVLLKLLGRRIPVAVPCADVVARPRELEHDRRHFDSRHRLQLHCRRHASVAPHAAPDLRRPGSRTVAGEPGPGDVDRVVRMALRGIWDPPTRFGAQVPPVKPRPLQ